MDRRVLRTMQAVLACVLVFSGCARPQRKCPDFQHEVTPASEVDAPAVQLAGFPLNASRPQAEAICREQGGQWSVEHCPFDHAAKSVEAAAPSAVLLRFDSFGALKGMEIDLARNDAKWSFPEAGSRYYHQALASIAKQLGWPEPLQRKCPPEEDSCALYEGWNAGGGTLSMRLTASASSATVEFEYSHPDMAERVIYGLPNCIPDK